MFWIIFQFFWSFFFWLFFFWSFFFWLFFFIVFFCSFFLTVFFCSFFFVRFFSVRFFFVRFFSVRFFFVRFFLFVFFVCFFYFLSAFYRKRAKKITMIMIIKNDLWMFSMLIKTVFFVFNCYIVFIFLFCAWSFNFHYFVCEIAYDVIYEIAWQQYFSFVSTICLLLKIDFDVLFFDEIKISKCYFVWISFFCFLFFVISSKRFLFLLNLKNFVFFFKIKISKAVIMTAFVYLFDRRISKWSNKSMKKKI